jgi:hypothetical protein
LQRVDVLRDRRLLVREIGLRGEQDLLRLAKIGARRHAASEPRIGQGDAALRTSDGVLRDLQQALVRRVGKPGIGDVADQRQASRPGRGFGLEIAVERGAGQRADTAEQVELERRGAEVDGEGAVGAGRTCDRPGGACSTGASASASASARARARATGSGTCARSTGSGSGTCPAARTCAGSTGRGAARTATAARVAVTGAGIDLREQVATLDTVLRAGRCDVRGGDAEIAIVRQRLDDDLLEPRILEHVAVGECGECRFGLTEVRIADRP